MDGDEKEKQAVRSKKKSTNGNREGLACEKKEGRTTSMRNKETCPASRVVAAADGKATALWRQGRNR